MFLCFSSFRSVCCILCCLANVPFCFWGFRSKRVWNSTRRFVSRDTRDLEHTWSLLWNSVTVFCPSRLPPLRQTSVCVHRAVGPGCGSDPPGGLAARPLLLSAAPGQAAQLPPARPCGQGHPQGHQHRWEPRCAECSQRDATSEKAIRCPLHKEGCVSMMQAQRLLFHTCEQVECVSPNKTCPIRLGGWQDTWPWPLEPRWPLWSRAAPSLLQLWLHSLVGALSSLQNCASLVYLAVFYVESQQHCSPSFRTFCPKMMQIFQAQTENRMTKNWKAGGTSRHLKLAVAKVHFNSLSNYFQTRNKTIFCGCSNFYLYFQMTVLSG